MLPVGAVTAVDGRDGPVVILDVRRLAAGCDHGLDRQHQSGLDVRSGVGRAVVEDARRLVHLASDAVADVLAQDAVGLPRDLRVALRLDVPLDGRADLADAPGGRHGCDARPHRPLGHARQLLAHRDQGGTGLIRNDHRDGAVAVPVLELRSAVDRHDVAGLQHAITGDAVHHLVIHRHADRVVVPAHQLEVRLRPARTDGAVRDRVELERRDTRPNQRPYGVERRSGDEPRLDHGLQLRRRLVDGSAEHGGQAIRRRRRGRGRPVQRRCAP